MAKRALEGGRIRRIRSEKGLKQVAVAEASGISASYLNLIEHNRRPVAGALLGRIAGALDVAPAAISEGTEGALVEGLEAAAARSPDIKNLEPLEGFAGRFPAWARLVGRLDGRIGALERTVESLNDRLAHDPVLAASLHNMLSTVTSIRSTSGILTSGDTIEPEWQARFHRNIHEDSQRLTKTADGLVTYLENAVAGTPERGLPMDEVEAWLERANWRVAAAESTDSILSVAGRAVAKRILNRSMDDATKLPESDLLAALSGDLDVVAMADALGADPDLVMRRLAELPTEALPGGQGVGLVVCDASGTITFRKPVRGFDPPRHGATCALWPLFEAVRRPAVPVRRRLKVRGRDTVSFEATAFATATNPMGFDAPSLVEATMLLRPIPGEAGLPVGMACRVCAEHGCPGRREPSVLHPEGAAGA